LPFYPAITREQVAAVAGAVKKLVAELV